MIQDFEFPILLGLENEAYGNLGAIHAPKQCSLRTSYVKSLPSHKLPQAPTATISGHGALVPSAWLQTALLFSFSTIT